MCVDGMMEHRTAIGMVTMNNMIDPLMPALHLSFGRTTTHRAASGQCRVEQCLGQVRRFRALPKSDFETNSNNKNKCKVNAHTVTF